MGVPGAGTTTELLLLKTWIPKAKPKMVLLGLLPSNDILNNHPELERKSDKPFLRLNAYREGNITFDMPDIAKDTHPMAQYSHTLRWALRRWNQHTQTKDKVALGDGISIDWHIYNSTVTPTWEEGWSITQTLIQEIKGLCEDNGVEFGVVIFPSIEEISLDHQRTLLRQHPTLSNWTFDLEDRSLKMLQEAGLSALEVHSLYPTFKSHALPTTLHYPQDHHWTPEGHALASQSINDWLNSRH